MPSIKSTFNLFYQTNLIDKNIFQEENNITTIANNALHTAKHWIGITDIGTGIVNIRNKDYRTGMRHLMIGSVRLAATAAVVVGAVQGIRWMMSSPHTIPTDRPLLAPPPQKDNPSPPQNDNPPPPQNDNPPPPQNDTPSPPQNDKPPSPQKEGEIPLIQRSHILSETINQPKGMRKVVVITAYDDGIKEYAQYVIPNQRNFATKQGYDYIEYHGNLAHDNGIPRAPYWSKIVAINDQLQKTKDGDWIAWTDASAIFTNTDKNFDEIIDRYGAQKEIIVTNDPQVKINNAVFLLKNSPFTREWIQKVWSRSDLAVGGKKNCWLFGHPFCHYEQQAMTELYERDRAVQEKTKIISNKIMNSFYRYSHWDPDRKLEQTYDNDKESSKWSTGDFICKVTGMDKVRRLKIIKYVINNCVDKFCERKIIHPLDPDV